MKTILLPILLLQLCSGCVSTDYTGPAKVGETPAHLHRVSLFGDQRASEVDLINGTMKGYTSDQAQVAGAIAGAVAGGVAQGMAKALARP